jgi:integrase
MLESVSSSRAVSPASKGCSATTSQRKIERSALHTAADAAGLRVDDARLRLHDLRHTFASHLIIDLGLDVV